MKTDFTDKIFSTSLYKKGMIPKWQLWKIVYTVYCWEVVSIHVHSKLI